jgi:hypothetical protein
MAPLSQSFLALTHKSFLFETFLSLLFVGLANLTFQLSGQFFCEFDHLQS